MASVDPARREVAEIDEPMGDDHGVGKESGPPVRDADAALLKLVIDTSTCFANPIRFWSTSKTA